MSKETPAGWLKVWMLLQLVWISRGNQLSMEKQGYFTDLCLPGWVWHLGQVASVQAEQEPVLVQGLHNSVAQDTGLHIQAEGLGPGQTPLERQKSVRRWGGSSFKLL